MTRFLVDPDGLAEGDLHVYARVLCRRCGRCVAEAATGPGGPLWLAWQRRRATLADVAAAHAGWGPAGVVVAEVVAVAPGTDVAVDCWACGPRGPLAVPAPKQSMTTIRV